MLLLTNQGFFKRPVLFFTIFLMVSSAAFGQSIERSVLGTSGGSFTNNTISLNSTVGEASISTLSAGDRLLTQGFQQGDTLKTAISVKGERLGTLKIYPNPTIDHLNIEVPSFIQAGLSYQLYNSAGQSMPVAQEKTATGLLLRLNNLSAGTYQLVLTGDHFSDHYKIIKSN